MTHPDARAQIAALFEGNPSGVQPPELLAHLKGCDDCRAVYDTSARVVRRLRGNAEQMAPEELVLFAPPLPPAKVVPLFRTGPTVGLALAAGLAAVVFWVTAPKDEFSARGAGPRKRADAPTLRVLCAHEGALADLSAHTCAEGDKLLFAVTPNGRTDVALVVAGNLLGTTTVEPTATDAPLSFAARFKPGVSATAIFSAAAVDAAAADACARGSCAAGLTAVTVAP